MPIWVVAAEGLSKSRRRWWRPVPVVVAAALLGLAAAPAGAQLSSRQIRSVVTDGPVTAVAVHAGRVFFDGSFYAVAPRTGSGVLLRRDSGQRVPTPEITGCARWHRCEPDGALHATRQALRPLARRHQVLDAEIAEPDADILRLTRQAAPRLLAQPGIGPETAARLLIVAGDNSGRLRSDAALTALCGASPVEASRGQTIRYRLNRGGDRQGNNALWTIADNRMIHHPETRDYVKRRSAEGKNSKEIRRCVRTLARRLYPLPLADVNDARTIPT
jgi:hypothetical protein